MVTGTGSDRPSRSKPTRLRKAKVGALLLVAVATVVSGGPVLALSFSDGFETIPVGAFPSANGWQIHTTYLDQVSASAAQAYSGAESLEFEAVRNAEFARPPAYVSFGAIPSRVTYGASVWLPAGSCGEVSLTRRISGWEAFVLNSVSFNPGGEVSFVDFGDPTYNDAVTIGHWTPGEWHRLEVGLDLTAGTTAVLLDGIRLAQDLPTIVGPVDNAFLGIGLGGQGTRAYFDDVFVRDTGPRTFAVLTGSRAPAWHKDGTEVPDAIRGDLSVDMVAEKLPWAQAAYTVKATWDAASSFPGTIEAAVSAVAERVVPNDTLVFYYFGHGDGSSSLFYDEKMVPGSGGLYSDDALTALLADARLADVRKIVFLDSCHSGGFWNNDWLLDKDLETLKRIALFAAAEEDGTAVAYDGIGLFTRALVRRLAPSLTYEQLAEALNVAYTHDVTGFFLDQGYGTVAWQPVAYFSDDFNADQWLLGGGVVPEPSTVALLASGFGTALIVRRSRKPKVPRGPDS